MPAHPHLSIAPATGVAPPLTPAGAHVTRSSSLEERPIRDSSDAILLARLASDDAGALDVLLERHWGPIVAFIERLTGSRDVAQDAAQETFCRLWERRGTWRIEGAVRGLLFRLARNIAISEHRQHRARERASRLLADLSPSVASPACAPEDQEFRSAIERAVAALPPRRREVFLLRVVHELSYKEIAAVMGGSTQTVANQLSHALATLRRTLAHLLD